MSDQKYHQALTANRKLLDENARLKAELERLTKAGDEMASIIKYHPEVNTFDPVPDVVKRWNAAKEGNGHE